ncbi:unnamed protein product [Ectocarpus sp. 6 AP-2014]
MATTSANLLEVSIETVIFSSYTLLSTIVLVIYYRHKDYLDSRVNRILAVTFGLFLMLCAMTHLRAIWYDHISVPLSVSCAAVSFIAAICALCRVQSLDDYLTLRISTSKILRERTIQNLTAGYDLRCVAIDNSLVTGFINGYSGGFPVEFSGGIDIGNIIKMGDRFFRVVSAVMNTMSHRHWSELELAPSASSSGTTIFAYDATAEVHMSKEEERMNEMKMAMCMSTAHDVRTPLASLGIVISSLRSNADVDENCTKLLDEAIVNVEVLNLVTTQFMDIGMMGSGVKIKGKIDALNVVTMLNRIKNVCTRLVNENVDAHCEVQARVPPSLLTDVEWVWQILMNLVTNAAKYTHRGRIDVVVGYRDDCLELRVEDTGIGIDDSKKGAVFGKYVTHQTYGHASHGIGLYSVKTKVDALGGSCRVLDNPGGGTVFEVLIPAKVDKDIDTDSPSGSGRSVSLRESGDIPRGTCLIVDDTASIRKMMQHFLKKHDVDLACNGAEGLERLKKKEYDIVLMDISMPVMDGRECLARFREWEAANRSNRQRIYSMSANVIEVDAGFDGSLPKPMDARRLRRLLQKRGSSMVHPV